MGAVRRSSALKLQTYEKDTPPISHHPVDDVYFHSL